MIDRRSLVERHHPVLSAPDPLSPLTVGNGRFAFTADVTGLQTFAEAYENGIPLHTQAQWAWHRFANPEGYQLEDVLVPYDVNGRSVPYADGGTHRDAPPAVAKAARYLRANPHRLDLGRIGLWIDADQALTLDNLSDLHQTLDLWQGCIRSTFQLLGEPVQVCTACHPDLDAMAVEISSPLLEKGKLGIRIAFPYGSEDWKRAADWERPEAHCSADSCSGTGATIQRTLDEDGYLCQLRWEGDARWKREGPHTFVLQAGGGTTLSAVVGFAPREPVELSTARQTIDAAAKHWGGFWSSGGAIDLSASTDPRASEIERRVVLSQYLMAVNCAGDAPPQETGLTYNSWFGKMHLEMHWWHGAHFALWGRPDLLERSLGWYQDVLPLAQEHAKRQGYEGARWPKMVGPDGQDSPSPIAVFLIWQQPHPIYFAELIYRDRQDRETLDRYQEIVFETARFMASIAEWDASQQRYNLGPMIIPAQESYGGQRQTNLNPPYELAYWHWALGVAQQWRRRLGMDRCAVWDDVRDHLAVAPTRNGMYDAIETPPHLVRKDHPSMLAALGVMPQTPIVEPETMSTTLDSVLADWDWPSTWGWDYPVMAMTAARLGRPDDAVNALLLDAPKNVYLPNGHNYQDQRLTVYLPGNGGLLTAVAMMAAGWDHGPDRHAPGFPTDGWTVEHEGLRPMP